MIDRFFDTGYQEAAVAEATRAPEPAEDWAIVELMGHRQRAGRISEAQRFGTALLRIDIPVDGGFVTEFYGGASIYALRSVTEAVARAFSLRLSDPRPVAPAGFRTPQIETIEADDDDV